MAIASAHDTEAFIATIARGTELGRFVRALAIGSISYGSGKSILTERLDRLAPPGEPDTPPPPTHENLRGPSYWSEEA